MDRNKFSFFSFKNSSKLLPIFVLGCVVGFFAAFVARDEFFISSYRGNNQKIASSQTVEKKISPFPFEVPASSPIIKRHGYTLSYDGKNRVPGWVFEHLNHAIIKGDAELHRYRFQEDDTLPKHLRSTLDDYYGSGFERAHLCPAQDQKSSSKAMYDTFYLSNALPISPELASGYFGKLEKQVREWTKKFQNIYVVTGPLYLPSEENGERVVKYRVIGPHDVAVPTHLYKVLLLEKSSGEMSMCAFLIPNENIPMDTSLETYMCSVRNIETLSGLEFFKDLKTDFAESLKNASPSNLW